ncbi:UDP-glycosyltransferase UGT5-like isoform X1 [Adelges cooleyi]|uniref:UDP-glycosyltransferase UGT5-like isoform X1 n=1 Tax=Adelges cooleyi TaxID=133065 RepID=UPI0021808761|nr:UDP-glycosyltransferase UGT5-like isoform X1 [Adelges cooleyi]
MCPIGVCRHILFLWLVWGSTGVRCANILGVFPIEARSHQLVFDAYMLGLHQMGHNVTVYTHFPDAGAPYNRVRVNNVSLLSENYLTIDNMYSPSIVDSYRHMFRIVLLADTYTDSAAMRQLYGQPEDSYDLIITETCNTDLYLALVAKFKVPFIAWTTSPLFVWSADRVAAPTHPAYIPVLMSPYGPDMHFLQRLHNVFLRSMAFVKYHTDSAVFSQSVASEKFQSSPPLTERVLETALLFVDTHYTVWGSRPLPPGVIEVGGLHIKPPKSLDKDIQQFIDESEHGVIYFCMGSLLRGETFAAEKRSMFLNAFQKLPQRVLWKWENDDLPDKTANIMIRKWMPQRDILAHPKVKLFISHGGLLGLTEAVHEGVPTLAMPIFGDQLTNVKAIMDTGAAEILDYNTLSEIEIFSKAKEMLTNPIYKQKATKLSEVFRDRPMSPMETAMYWTEYVIRHKGAPHLRSPAVGMPWYQYYMIDIISMLLICVFAILLSLHYFISTILSLLRPSKKLKIN